MLDAPPVHWQVPPAPELLHSCRVPPVQVECPLTAAGHLGHQREERVEDDMEARQPGQHVDKSESQISEDE